MLVVTPGKNRLKPVCMFDEHYSCSSCNVDVSPIVHWRMAVVVCIPQFHYVPADVATEEGCSRLASEANRLMGGIDGLVSGRRVLR